MGWHDSTISARFADAQTGAEVIDQRLHENDEVPSFASFASRSRASLRGAAVK
jgi:hypothetical protein